MTTPSETIQRFLEEIKKHDEAATKGPWHLINHSWEQSGVYANGSRVAMVQIRSVTTEEVQDAFERIKEADAGVISFFRTALPKAGEVLAYVLNNCFLNDEDWEQIARIIEGER
jgi:hypothetical protein